MAPLVVDPCGYLKPHHSVGHCPAATPDSTTCHPSATNNTTNPRPKPHNHPVSTKPGQLQSHPLLGLGEE